MTVDTVQPGRQTNLHSTACRKLKVPNCSVRRHAHLYTPTTPTVSPPHQKQSSCFSWKMQIKHRCEKPCPAYWRRPGVHHSSAHPCLIHSNAAHTHCENVCCFAQPFAYCDEEHDLVWRSGGPEEKPDPGGQLQISGFSDRTVEKNEESRHAAVFLGEWANTFPSLCVWPHRSQESTEDNCNQPWEQLYWIRSINLFGVWVVGLLC